MAEPEVDKKLEMRLFDLLERRARVRLGALVQLRRRSRSKGITLLQAALDANQVEPAAAAAIAKEAGLPHPRARAHEQRDDAEHTASTESSVDSVSDAFDLGSLDLLPGDADASGLARRPGDRNTLRQPPSARPGAPGARAPAPGGRASPPAMPGGAREPGPRGSGEVAVHHPGGNDNGGTGGEGGATASSTGLRALGALPPRALARKAGAPTPEPGTAPREVAGPLPPLGPRHTPPLLDEVPPRRAVAVASPVPLPASPAPLQGRPSGRLPSAAEGRAGGLDPDDDAGRPRAPLASPSNPPPRAPGAPPPLPALRAPEALPRRPVPVDPARRGAGEVPVARAVTDAATTRMDRPPARAAGALARPMVVSLEASATLATDAVQDFDFEAVEAAQGASGAAPDLDEVGATPPAEARAARERLAFASTGELPDLELDEVVEGLEDEGAHPLQPADLTPAQRAPDPTQATPPSATPTLVGNVGGRFLMGPRPPSNRSAGTGLVAPEPPQARPGAFATAVDLPGLDLSHREEAADGPPHRPAGPASESGLEEPASGLGTSGSLPAAAGSGERPGLAPAPARSARTRAARPAAEGGPDTVIGDAWTGDTAPPDGADADDSVDLSVLNPRDAAERYALGNELGRGGMGQVLEAHDLALDRPVALKLMNEPDDVALQLRFIDEARVTGQLQHPAIPPVYELGRLGDGRPFFAMKRIEGRTLRDVLEDLRAGDGETTRTWGRVRLLTVFAQVCRAIAYAHSRSLMHRDLKPDNIMLGEFGEVTVMDWGLAKPFGAPDRPGGIATRRAETGRFSTQTGEITGTPQYMPPEQAAGEVEALGAHTDIYALGAVLYELLTLEPPFDGPNMRAVRDAVIHDPVVPPSLRSPKRDIPHDFEQLCLHCLRKEPGQRPRSALYIAERVETSLEGEQDRARKDTEREHWMKLGRAAAAELEQRHEEHRQLQARAAVLRARTDPWDDGEARQALWGAEDAERRARLDAARVRSEGLAAFHAALGIDGDHGPARAALAELYWAAFEAAERDGDAEAMAHAETLVRAFDEAGRFTARLAGDGALLIEGLGAGLEATLSRVESRDRVRVPVDPRRLEGRPARVEPLAMGSYLLDVRGPGLSGTRVPIHIGRQESLRLRLRLFPDHVVGNGFVHITSGPARLGGDSQAALATPPRVVEIDDFFLARQPVTAGAYAVYLRDLARSNGAHIAQARAPRGTPRGAPLWPLDRDGVPVMPETDNQGLRWDPEWPVVCVSAEDAEAYCAWLGEQTGQLHRLPSDEEWEKAARGADGRPFPWGEAFEASFCHMGVSRSGPPRRGPSGRFPIDASPYGVLDLAGGVCEWTASFLDTERRQRVVKGGHWASGPIECRAASRVAQPTDQVLPTLGFRLARDAR